MAIVRLNPTAPANEPTTPSVTQVPEKSVMTNRVLGDSTVSLLKYVEGYKWSVELYAQLLNEGNTLENFDPSAPNISRPRYLLRNLAITVTSPLGPSYNNETGVTTLTGSALMPHGVRPNVGDVFVANVGDGERAIFLINVVSRKTHRIDTLYEVDYTLYAYASAEPQFVRSMESTVQETYFYNSKQGLFARQSLYTPEEYEAVKLLNREVARSITEYFQNFYFHEVGALVLPGTTQGLVFDPLIYKLVLETVPITEIVTRGISRYTTLDDRYIGRATILDAIQARSVNSLKFAQRKMSFVRTNTLMDNPRLGSASYSLLDMMLYPVDAPTVNEPLHAGYRNSGHFTDVRNEQNYQLSNELTVNVTENNDEVYTVRLAHALFENDSYIVSDAFYDYLDTGTVVDSEVSYIELLIARHVKREHVSAKDLMMAMKDYGQMSPLHQFYLLPVLWVMAKTILE